MCPWSCKLPNCGNGVIDSEETCLNCPRDVGKCVSICEDGIADPGETCENCPEDIKNCSGECGNEVIDEDL